MFCLLVFRFGQSSRFVQSSYSYRFYGYRFYKFIRIRARHISILNVVKDAYDPAASNYKLRFVYGILVHLLYGSEALELLEEMDVSGGRK